LTTSVYGQRVDVETLEALHQRAAGASVERHALLDLRGHRRVLQEKDVSLRVARAEHGHEVSARAMPALLDLPRQLVQLADRPLEVLLAYLVVGCPHPA
jgi:hypothetical protein